MTTTVQEALTTKLERTFDAVDANHDGYVDWSDYKALGDRYIEAYKLDKDDRRARAIQAFWQHYFLELLRHSDGAGQRLTKGQFVTANRIAVIDTSRLNVADGAGHVIFDIMDANEDNEITRDEFTRLLKDVWKSEAPNVMDVFAKLDTDGDGAISRQEFVRAVREHFLSNNPDAPGSLFFGPI
ncbi:EF-hand domain-containing protein [Streptomyces sp. NPDC002676]